ncbi:MAG: Ldh family oxidoreductase [Oscillospiraceae bacterium]|nr:Ldh family oxidoreductase [Oscillospiraceae bacterium]
MAYRHLAYEDVKKFCIKVFQAYGFSQTESEQVTDVLLEADLSGIESHGIQRLTRYHFEMLSGFVKLDQKPEIVKETPISALIDGHDGMGQLIGIQSMQLAIEKAKKCGVGIVAVRDSNHYGIAGYYANMAARENLIGICMTNTESIMVPTFGKEAILGTNPIAFAMPADPVPFSFDAATTVVPRGKLEVYAKRGNGLPEGWALDETGHPSTDSDRVLKNIIAKSGGGILPLGGAGELTSGYKGYGFAMICEIMTGILASGCTSNHVNRTPGRVNTAQCFMALDYGMFGDKAEIEAHMSAFLQEIRDSQKADGENRIYIHGEKEFENHAKVLREGIPVNEKTYSEMIRIGEYAGASDLLPRYID